MDIRNWPLERIMQLPDHFFGRRFMFQMYVNVTVGKEAWDISELALPDRCVLWEMSWGVIAASVTLFDAVRFALGDKVPASAAEFDALEQLLPLAGTRPAARPGFRFFDRYNQVSVTSLRMPISAQGRKVIMEVYDETGTTLPVVAHLVFSSIPTEIPDCLLAVKSP